jgi:hypothetical protein
MHGVANNFNTSRYIPLKTFSRLVAIHSKQLYLHTYRYSQWWILIIFNYMNHPWWMRKEKSSFQLQLNISHQIHLRCWGILYCKRSYRILTKWHRKFGILDSKGNILRYKMVWEKKNQIIFSSSLFNFLFEIESSHWRCMMQMDY